MSQSSITRLTTTLVNAMEREEGQGLVEYALLLLLIAVAAVGTLTIFGTSVSAMFTTVSGAF